MSDLKIPSLFPFPSRLEMPPSKSHTMRALTFALMAKGTSVIENPLLSPDTYSMLSILTSFGASFEIFSDRIEIKGVNKQLRSPRGVLDVGNSGIALRFMSALSALMDTPVVLTGDDSIRNLRVITPLVEGLRQMGASLDYLGAHHRPPLRVRGPIFPKENVLLDGEDSQPVSALLIAASFLEGKTHFTISNPGEKPWVGMTLSWLRSLGISYENQNFSSYTIFGSASYDGFYRRIPGDFSSAAYPAAAALVLKKEIFLENLFLEDSQGDKKLFSLLQEMGAYIEMTPSYIYIDGKRSTLHGKILDLNDCIDALPIVAALAPFAEGCTEVRGAKVARKKESDRIQTIGRELRKMGAIFEEREDGFVIKQSPLRGAILHSHNDHRIALALSVAAMGASGESLLQNIECVNKSYPSFFRDIGIA